MQKIVRGAVALLAFAAGTAAAQGKSEPGLDLQCVALERASSCGCSLKIAAQACSPPAHLGGGHVHFFSALHQGAPLEMNIRGRALSLPSLGPVDSSIFYPERGDSWQEEYQQGTVKVRIRYRPGESSCPAEKEQEDGCEFFDVAADVEVAVGGERFRQYQAVGTCGC